MKNSQVNHFKSKKLEELTSSFETIWEMLKSSQYMKALSEWNTNTTNKIEKFTKLQNFRKNLQIPFRKAKIKKEMEETSFIVDLILLHSRILKQLADEELNLQIEIGKILTTPVEQNENLDFGSMTLDEIYAALQTLISDENPAEQNLKTLHSKTKQPLVELRSEVEKILDKKVESTHGL